MNPVWAVGLNIALAAVTADRAALTRFEATEVHMGTNVTIVVYAESPDTANPALRAAFERIRRVDEIMSDYREDSELNRLSRQSPTPAPVPVSPPLWTVLQAARELSEASDGAFDVTVGPLSRLWRRARRQKQFPAATRLAEARESVGYRLLKLHPRERAVELLGPRMQLDLGGIAKGYAADQALEELRQRGLPRALVNAGGDLAIGDPPPGEDGWKVGVAPLGPAEPPSRLLSLARCGVATSGDAWQFVEIDGQRYSHILDPRTGLGLTDHAGVSLIAADGMTADALASAVSVLGPEAGLKLVDRTAGAAALVVRVEHDGIKTYESLRFRKLPRKESD
ncbi:MAG: FAD:protein FMN transferase [Pirellulaceae bacterium]|nr:FAD:protein FMN transferase [Pirellulaceae bacterium]